MHKQLCYTVSLAILKIIYPNDNRVFQSLFKAYGPFLGVPVS